MNNSKKKDIIPEIITLKMSYGKTSNNSDDIWMRKSLYFIAEAIRDK